MLFLFPKTSFQIFGVVLTIGQKKKSAPRQEECGCLQGDEAGPRRRQETSAPSCNGKGCMITSIFLILSFTDIHSSCSI